MNHRVLELLKTPKNIQSEDLHLLKEEINSFPYVQNIRALYLYGVHLYDKENYQGVLSTTAAYTTDKKILYQLINGKIQQLPKPENKQEAVQEKSIPAENPLKLLYKAKITGFPIKREEAASNNEQAELTEAPEKEVLNHPVDDEGRILPPPREKITHLYVEGERNRILYEGEENFLQDDTADTIDLESTLESGSIVTQKNEKKEESLMISEENLPVENVLSENVETPAIEENEEENSDASSEADFHEVSVILEAIEDNPEETGSSEVIENELENSEKVQQDKTGEFTKETIIEEGSINTEPEKKEILDESAVSFHETAAFLPDVQVSANDHEDKPEPVADHTEDSDLDKGQIAEFTPEKIIHEDNISSEKVENTVQDESELSFHGMDSFLPEVKIQANEQETMDKVPQSNLSKHEDEMRRLIEEVEKKMKEKAVSEEPEKGEEPNHTGHDISFAETQPFEVKESEAKEEGAETEKENRAEEASEVIDGPKDKAVEEKAASGEEQPSEVKSSWKPMSLDSNLPDSLLSKKSTETSQPTESPVTEPAQTKGQAQKSAEDEEKYTEKNNKVTEDLSHEPEAKPEEKAAVEDSENNHKQEAPVMNVSFFGSGWTISQSEKKKDKEQPEHKIEVENETENKAGKSYETSGINTLDSNVPGFINTWQSWLKIDRTEEPEKDKTEVKNKVIETFIENNPRISQLKEESSFVIREKGDDISHLMTETLANLYFEQKLYTKAVKAFEILIRKTPEKKKYYEGKIQEIKDFRTKG